MHRLLIGIFVASVLTIACVETADAASSDVLIVRVQASGMVTNTGDQEAVEIKNTSNSTLDVTNWCISNVTREIGCITPPDNHTKLLIGPESSVLFTTSTLEQHIQISLNNTGFKKDVELLKDNINLTSGTLQLLDKSKQIIDEVRWGSEANSAPKLENGKMLQRKDSADTDNSSVDFEKISTDIGLYQYGGLFEEVIVTDQCPNIVGLQAELPEGYMRDEQGDCYGDMCTNIPNLQKEIPQVYYRLGSTCFPYTLTITELLPNVRGSDTGREYIELYNPNDVELDISQYYLQLGSTYSKSYPLPSMSIAPKQYIAISDTISGLILPNTVANVRIYATQGELVDETLNYDTPKDDESWALIDGLWRYTDQATPAAANLSRSVSEEEPVQEEAIAVCPVGKYRNPETNRCKIIETVDQLKPCAVDQVRNLETNRCRSIFSAVSSSLTPCKQGQERSSETNRCRSIVTSSSASLKPCAPGQERSPETNRCRKKVAESNLGKIVEEDASQVAQFSDGFLVAGVAIAGFGGYALWEWRTEALSAIRRFKELLAKNPPTD